MTDDEIKQYRSAIDTQLKEKETDIETTISYITLGLLGLFLTINEKFVPLASSQYKFILFTSVLSFVISFCLGLINKFQTTKFDRQIIDILDEKDLTNDDEEQELLKKWQSSDTKLQTIRKWIYSFLVIGLVAQLIYFFANLKDKPEDNTIKIEMIFPKDTTINVNNTNVHIYQPSKEKK